MQYFSQIGGSSLTDSNIDIAKGNLENKEIPISYVPFRNANILAEVIGYGSSGDAHHITSPPDDGNGAERCVLSALNDAQKNPEDINYINAHGTSTPVGDKIEIESIKKVFSNEYNLKLFLLFCFLLLQGIIGWYMVKSVLIEYITVSHF